MLNYYSYVYRYKFDRLPACTSQVHALLHLADQVRAAGPPRAYWSFWVERSCSNDISKLQNRRHPFKNLELEIQRFEKVRSL